MIETCSELEITERLLRNEIKLCAWHRTKLKAAKALLLEVWQEAYDETSLSPVGRKLMAFLVEADLEEGIKPVPWIKEDERRI